MNLRSFGASSQKIHEAEMVSKTSRETDQMLCSKPTRDLVWRGFNEAETPEERVKSSLGSVCCVQNYRSLDVLSTVVSKTTRVKKPKLFPMGNGKAIDAACRAT